MAIASPITLDESTALIVITCTEHPWWSACRFYRDDAYEVACSHEEREHPMDNAHREARRHRSRRVACVPRNETNETRERF